MYPKVESTIYLKLYSLQLYTKYCFTLLHCNVAPSSFTFEIFFCGWNSTWNLCESSNFHSSCFFWNYFHPYSQLVKSFIIKIHLLPIIIQKFIHFPHSSKYWMFKKTFIHVHVIFIQHNYFGISFIHTFQFVESFIQTIFYPRHQIIPNIFVLVHRLMFTSSCSRAHFLALLQDH